MTADQLRIILREYPPHRKLHVIVDGTVLEKTTVQATLDRLAQGAPEFTPLSSTPLTYFGRDSCVIRERFEDLDAPPGAAPTQRWLEIDLR